MARYTDSVCRLCRREGCKLFLKGNKCYGEKCPLDKRHSIPGEHGQARQRKMSEYGLQLREKQKAKRAYGMLESQFHKYFEEAERQKGVTGDNLLVMLERRLDNVVYRLGFAASRAMARQIVLHGHILVNGKKVNIASYLVKVGDVISVKPTSIDNKYKITVKSDDGESKVTTYYFQDMREGTGKVIPKWLTIDAQNLKATVDAMPQREDVDLSIQENLIVELYSR